MTQIPMTRAGISRAHVAVVVGVVLLAAAWEWQTGRPPICPCGRIALWANDARGPENSQMIADWYSLSHVVHGLLFFGALWLVARRWPIGVRLILATLVEAMWELTENSPFLIERYRAVTAATSYSGDSILNSMSDIGFMILGFFVASRLPAWATVALGILLELVALAVIRDNLTLNVLMLLHPIDAVRVWQEGG